MAKRIALAARFRIPEQPDCSFCTIIGTVAYKVLSSFLAVTSVLGVTVPKSILIADDSVAVRTGTRRFLESQPGFKVCAEAIDGIDAVEKARHYTPDLIILDLQMPRMNGLEAARELRNMRISAPIILFTMYADAVRPRVAQAAGITAVVSKSNLSELQVHLANLLES